MKRILLSALLVIGAQLAAAERPTYQTKTLEGSDRTVYLIPGLASPGSVWDELADELVAEGHRVRILTLAGFAGLPPLEGDHFLPLVRDQLAAELAASEGPAPVIVGHSLGAFMALWLAATEADNVAGVVAVDGVPYLAALGRPDATPQSQRAQAEQMAQYMASLTPEQYAAQNRMALSGMVTDPAEVERFAAEGGRSDPATVGRAVAEMLTTDLRGLMPQIEAPVILIQAADSGADENMRRAYADQVAGIPDHRHVVADRGRHFVQLDNPEFVREQVFGLLKAVGDE